MPATDPRCSIVIPVFNRAELTRQCVDELLRVTTDVPYELIVVDNGSTDGTAELLAALPDARVIRNAENAGFARACNQGAAIARAPHLVFLNNDTIPLPGWLAALVDEVDRRPEVTVVGSKLLYGDGTLQHAGVGFSRAAWGPYHLYRGLPASLPAAGRRRELRAVTAACLLVRRAAFAAAGGFDEGYRNGFEDIDLCLTVHERGGRIVYQPASVVYHLESQTPGRKAHDRENFIRLRRRWEHALLEDEDAIYVADGYAMRASVDGSGIHFRLEPLGDATARRAWERVAEAQDCAARRDVDRLASLLATADGWPPEPFVLVWAQRLAHRLGLPAETFCRRLLAADVPPGLSSLLLVTDVPTDDADAPFARAVLRHASGGRLCDRLDRAIAHVRLGNPEGARRECDAIRALAPGFAGFGAVEQLAARVREARGSDVAREPAVTFVLSAGADGDARWTAAVESYLRAFGPDDPCLLWLRAGGARLTTAECLQRLAPVLAPFGASRFAPVSVSDDPDEPLPGARIVPVDEAAVWAPEDFRRHLPTA